LMIPVDSISKKKNKNKNKKEENDDDDNNNNNNNKSSLWDYYAELSINSSLSQLKRILEIINLSFTVRNQKGVDIFTNYCPDDFVDLELNQVRLLGLIEQWN